MKGENIMKKLVSLIAAALISINGFSAVFAETDSKTVVGVYGDGVMCVGENPGNADFAVLNIYSDGKLSKSGSASYENGCYSFVVSADDAVKDMRIVYRTGEVYTVTAEKEITPQPTAEPTAAPTAAPTQEPIPEVYEKQADALNAPAVITEISETSIDGENYLVFEMLYQGKYITTNVRDYITIKSAPQKENYLVGNTVEYLCKGDVIHFACDLQGRMKNVDLLFRPDFKDYIEDGTALDSVIGRDNYSQIAFGVAVEGNKKLLLLADENGDINDVEVSEKAFVYTLSGGKRGDVADLYGIGANAVSKTYIEKDNYDDDGSVISWNGVEDKVYVIARVVRGLATEIFVIE